MLSEFLGNFMCSVDTDVGQYFDEVDHENLFRVYFLALTQRLQHIAICSLAVGSIAIALFAVTISLFTVTPLIIYVVWIVARICGSGY